METVSAWPELASILVAVPARMELHKDFKRSRPLEVLKDDDSVAEELQESAKNIANGHMHKEQKLENMSLSMGMQRL